MPPDPMNVDACFFSVNRGMANAVSCNVRLRRFSMTSFTHSNFCIFVTNISILYTGQTPENLVKWRTQSDWCTTRI